MGETRESPFQYIGSLTDMPVPVVLKKIYDYRVPGVLTFQREAAIKKIYVKDGRIIFASSNQKDDRLGEFLLRRGVIDEATFQEASRRLRMNPDKRLGRILVEMGVLTPHQLFQAVQDQILAIVSSVFAWAEGVVHFVVGPSKDEELIQLHLPIPRAIVMGARWLPNPQRYIEALGGPDGYVEMVPQLRLEVHVLGLLPDERRLLPLLDGTRTLRTILEQSPIEPDMAVRLLYGLHVLERIRIIHLAE
ncbi:hypothetical protein HRbin11_00488 [bacterium HR11]|nr:hypothetical protein HRbin11_00488 [bacterium HR11]